MQESERYACVGGMHERALSLNDVPMIRGRIRTQHFRSSSHEVADDGINWDTGSGNEDSSLAGRAKVGINARIPEPSRQGKGGVLLADGAVGSHCQKPLAGALASGCDRNIRRRPAYIYQLAAVALRGDFECRSIGELAVHPTHDVQSRLECCCQWRNPAIANDTADVRYADHYRSGATLFGLPRRHGG